MTEAEIEKHLRFVLRQMDGGIIPERVPMTPWLSERATEEEAQPVYDRLLKELEIEAK